LTPYSLVDAKQDEVLSIFEPSKYTRDLYNDDGGEISSDESMADTVISNRASHADAKSLNKDRDAAGLKQSNQEISGIGITCFPPALKGADHDFLQNELKTSRTTSSHTKIKKASSIQSQKQSIRMKIEPVETSSPTSPSSKPLKRHRKSRKTSRDKVKFDLVKTVDSQETKRDPVSSEPKMKARTGRSVDSTPLLIPGKDINILEFLDEQNMKPRKGRAVDSKPLLNPGNYLNILEFLDEPISKAPKKEGRSRATVPERKASLRMEIDKGRSADSNPVLSMNHKTQTQMLEARNVQGAKIHKVPEQDAPKMEARVYRIVQKPIAQERRSLGKSMRKSNEVSFLEFLSEDRQASCSNGLSSLNIAEAGHIPTRHTSMRSSNPMSSGTLAQELVDGASKPTRNNSMRSSNPLSSDTLAQDLVDGSSKPSRRTSRRSSNTTSSTTQKKKEKSIIPPRGSSKKIAALLA
jgi:hypothetical protein